MLPGFRCGRIANLDSRFPAPHIQDGKIVEGSPAGEVALHAAIWQHCLNFFVATKRMLRGVTINSITPNDAAGRTARLGVNRHHRTPQRARWSAPKHSRVQ